MENIITDRNNAIIEVKKGAYSSIRTRFDTILKSKGLQWSEVYKKLGMSKSYASQVRNGHIIPTPSLRIKIAETIGCDTSILWEAPDLIPANKIKIDQNGLVNSRPEATIKEEVKDDN